MCLLTLGYLSASDNNIVVIENWTESVVNHNDLDLKLCKNIECKVISQVLVLRFFMLVYVVHVRGRYFTLYCIRFIYVKDSN